MAGLAIWLVWVAVYSTYLVCLLIALQQNGTTEGGGSSLVLSLYVSLVRLELLGGYSEQVPTLAQWGPGPVIST
jgi:hypothetical protein